MKHSTPLTRAAQCLTLLLALAVPLAAHAWQDISGTVKVSQLTDNQIRVGRRTTLVVDVDKKIKNIACYDGDLTIQLNSGYTLTVDDDSEKYAILGFNYITLDITGPGTLMVTSKWKGIYNFGKLNINGGARVSVTGRNTYQSAGIYMAPSGKISIDNARVVTTGRYYGISSDYLSITNNAFVHATGRGTKHYETPGIDSRGFGISAGEVLIDNSEVTANSRVESGIWSYKDMTINNSTVTVNSNIGDGTTLHSNEINYETEGAILMSRRTKLVVNNSVLNLESNGHGINTFGSLEVNGGKINSHAGTYSAGIKCAGNLTFNGDACVTTNGSNYGIDCGGDAVINNAQTYPTGRADVSCGIHTTGKLIFTMPEYFSCCQARAKYLPFYAEGGIVFERPYMVTEEGVSMHPNGKAFQDSKGNAQHGSVNINRPAISYWTTPPSKNAGQCAAATNVAPGKSVTFVLPQAIRDYVNYPDAKMTVQWWMSKDADKPDDYVRVGTGTTCRTSEADKGKQLVAEVSFDTHKGSLLSDAILVDKLTNSAAPVMPDVLYQAGNLFVTNPQSTQEYLVLTAMKAVESITDADWKKAVTPDATTRSLRLNAAVDASVNYVYTRFKETATHNAGWIVKYVAAYRGASNSIEDVQLLPTGINCTVASEGGNDYLVPLNGIVRFDLKPVPETATGFTGVAGLQWSINFAASGDNSQNLLIYSDAACTQPVVADEDHYYKSVYVKFTKASGSARTGSGAVYGEYIHAYWNGDISKYVNHIYVADAQGNYALWRAFLSNGATPDGADYEALWVPAGTVGHYRVTFLPNAASPADLGLTLQSYSLDGVTGAGTPPVITYDPDTHMATVDAANTEAGFYGYYYMAGGKGDVRLYVTAPEATAIAVSPAEVTVEPGETVQLSALLTPANAKGTVTWSSSDTDVAIVDADGLVTLTADETRLGQTATVTATIGSLTATCVVTVGGTIFPITIGNVAVTSLNQDDVLGDGKVTFEGGTLHLNGTTVGAVEYSQNDVLPSLNIELAGDNKMSVTGTAMSFDGDVAITGSGSLTARGTVLGIRAAGNLFVDNNVSVTARGNSAGLYAKSLEVYGANSQLKALGVSDFSLRAVDDLWGEVAQPEGAYRNDGGYVVTAAGTTVTKAWVVINGIEVEDGNEDERIRGDVDGSGIVDVTDLNILINIMLGKVQASDYPGIADCDGNGLVDVTDMNTLINIMLGKG